MDKLEFTIEFNSDLVNKTYEAELMEEAESRLRALAAGHSDITGAAVTIRRPAKKETPPLHEATVVTYVRPENVVGKEKQESPQGALKGALDAVERQVRKKRDKLGEPWKRPQNDPISQEVVDIAAIEEGERDTDIPDIPDAEDGAGR
ncbi:MAG: HPF/RaiA family ribosome-associated protein [Chloroflexota bacterium]